MSLKSNHRLLAACAIAIGQGHTLMCQESGYTPSMLTPDRTITASDIAHRLQSLGVTTRVLHVAAHPDDENTRLLAYLVNSLHMDTAYLSLTRGDGGQNLIGPELRDYLGVIRTQELMAARKVDGAEQFFTRAVDFGFSKTSEETLRIWDHEAVLADTVWVIRKYQPQLLITRFGPLDALTHGHHTASTQLTLEAFEAAGDPERFPEQLQWVEPFQPTRVVWNTSPSYFSRRGLEFDATAFPQLEVGEYLPLIGASPGEISAKSRSQHKSQGFGAGAIRGPHAEYFELLAGEPMQASVFDGIPEDWSAYPESDTLNTLARTIARNFNLHDPAASVPDLLRFRAHLLELAPTAMVVAKIQDIDTLVADCLGLHLELRVPDDRISRGTRAFADLLIIQRLDGAKIELIYTNGRYFDAESHTATLSPNQTLRKQLQLEVPTSAPYSQPYWLVEPHSLGLFTVDDQRLIGTAENEPAISAQVSFAIHGQSITYTVPAVERLVDPVEGEIHRPAAIVPALYANFHDETIIFPTPEPKAVTLSIGGNQEAMKGEISLLAPEGWSVEPAKQPFHWSPDSTAPEPSFTVTPSASTAAGKLQAVLEVDGHPYKHSLSEIRYAHIPTQLFMPPAQARIIRLDLSHHGERIAYIPGAGDSVADNLRTVGFTVDELSVDTISADSLAGYDAVILGIRALNTIEGIDGIMPALFAYAEKGGTLIAQYNTGHRLLTNRVAPYPLTISRDRVTDEHAEVTLLAPEHRVLNYPNKLSRADFDDWVQERGLYFPSSWDAAFTPILSWHDQGEAPMAGSLLVAPYGDGYFVYTGISFFRQLPAGVPGAYRLFVNLLALSHDRE